MIQYILQFHYSDSMATKMGWTGCILDSVSNATTLSRDAKMHRDASSACHHALHCYLIPLCQNIWARLSD